MDILRQLRAFIKNPTQIRGLSVAGLVKQKVEILLPENAHEICSSKLGISLTKLWSMDNKFVSHFETRSDLIDAICAGCFIPVWSGSLVAPKYQGERYIDGAYSDNCPSFGVEASTDANVGRHIELSALMAEVDISPKDKSYMFKGKFMGTVYFASWDNIVRTTHAMLPFRMDTYECYLLNGHSHMKDYLMKNDLIKCRDCWQKASGNDDKAEATVAVVTLKQKTACVACLALLERVDSLTIPDKYRQIFRNYQ